MIPKIFLFEVDKNFKDAIAPLKVKEKLIKRDLVFFIEIIVTKKIVIKTYLLTASDLNKKNYTVTKLIIIFT